MTVCCLRAARRAMRGVAAITLGLATQWEYLALSTQILVEASWANFPFSAWSGIAELPTRN